MYLNSISPGMTPHPSVTCYDRSPSFCSKYIDVSDAQVLYIHKILVYSLFSISSQTYGENYFCYRFGKSNCKKTCGMCEGMTPVVSQDIYILYI